MPSVPCSEESMLVIPDSLVSSPALVMCLSGNRSMDPSLKEPCVPKKVTHPLICKKKPPKLLLKQGNVMVRKLNNARSAL